MSDLGNIDIMLLQWPIFCYNFPHQRLLEVLMGVGGGTTIQDWYVWMDGLGIWQK